MSYVTEQQLIDRCGEVELIQLTDRSSPPANAINSDVLKAAIADAAGVIDGFLGGRYRLPLSTVPVSLQRVAGDLVRYLLYDEHVPEHIEVKRKHAMDMLKAINEGKVNLGLDPAGGQAQTTDAAEMTSQETVFGRDKSKGFI